MWAIGMNRGNFCDDLPREFANDPRFILEFLVIATDQKSKHYILE